MEGSPDGSLIAEAKALYRAGHLAAAARLCQSITKRQPDHWSALHLLGVIALDRGYPGMALRFLSAAAVLGETPVRASLAAALEALGRPGEALAELAAAAAAAPTIPHYPFNRGNLLQRQGDFAGAEAAYRTALALDPGMVAAHWNLGLLLLRNGRLAEAWPEYEWRWRRPGTPVHYHIHPAWKGEEFSGRTLLLYAEQGLGDAIQFSRYLPLVAGRGGRVVLECPPELVRLFSASFPQISILPKGTPLPPFDLQASLPSLPAIFATTLETIPATIPYLIVPSTAEAEAVLSEAGGCLTVGLVWACSPTALSSDRTIGLAPLAPLLGIPGVRFYSLQVGPAARELTEGRHNILDLSPSLRDFADTAAMVSQLDLIISVDTAVVHLAGALARPVWVPLPYPADWRWLRERTDSPWYPTITLFRQTQAGGWSPVVAALAERLASLVKTASSTGSAAQ